MLANNISVNPAVRDQIGPNLKLMLDFMIVLLTCKNEDGTFKNIGARVLIRLHIILLDNQRRLTLKSVVESG